MATEGVKGSERWMRSKQAKHTTCSRRHFIHPSRQQQQQQPWRQGPSTVRHRSLSSADTRGARSVQDGDDVHRWWMFPLKDELQAICAARIGFLFRFNRSSIDRQACIQQTLPCYLSIHPRRSSKLLPTLNPDATYCRRCGWSMFPGSGVFTPSSYNVRRAIFLTLQCSRPRY